MYFLTRFEIDNFWGSNTLKCDLHEDVNIFIGLNGTGKTTLINLLQAALTVDVALLHELSFSEIRLILKQKSSTRRVTITRIPKKDSVYDFVRYKISHNSFELPLMTSELDMRRRFNSKYIVNLESIKKLLASLVDVSWLSVHRQNIQDEDNDFRSRIRKSDTILNPVDARLTYLLGQLSDYHLSLQAEANILSLKFQKQVLTSLLYSTAFDTFDAKAGDNINYADMREQLYHAYEALGFTTTIRKDIDEHTSRIQASITAIQTKMKKAQGMTIDDVLPYALIKRTRQIVDFSMKADEDKKRLFELLHQFIALINDFFDSDKKMKLSPKSEHGISIIKIGKEISFSQLSSGEKQLFILLAEAVLQKKSHSIFIADEPELSLHVAWQRKLITAVRSLNPNAQLIIATHSPEIAGPWRSSLIKMREVIS
jgi:predicted ATP-dependent endonuclease of OLD family